MSQSKEMDLLISLNAKERSNMLQQLDNEIDILCRPFICAEKYKEKAEKMHSFLALTVEETNEIYKVEIGVLSYLAKYDMSLLSGDVAQMNDALKCAWALVYSVVEKLFNFQRNVDEMNLFSDRRIRDWFMQIWHEHSIKMAESEIIH